jgi:ADP-ribose pyrophosphatase YjhB (NUDIX family)/phosphohistidine phosphatase SixA
VAQGVEVGVGSGAGGSSVTSIQAAGGVVVRRSGSGGHEVVLVHRPSYDDWTLPKGKLEPGEDLLQAAVREVREETGLGCLLGPGLGTVEYLDAHGRDKTAHYWAMAATNDGLAPTKEIDDARWVPCEDAASQLSYDRDRDVLSRAAAALPGDRPITVFLVRHAKAGHRDRWEGPDELRPLTPPGRAQAGALVPMLASSSPVVLVSSPTARCVQTLEPLGEACGLPVQQQEALAEGVAPESSLALLEAVGTLGTTVASTHGDVQENMIESLEAAGVPLSRPLRFDKGSTWELVLEDGRFTAGTYVPPPL